MKYMSNIVDKLFNCNDISLFVKSIVQVLPFSGASMSKFYMCEYDDIKFLTKICFYNKSQREIYGKKENNIMHNIDSEIKILKCFKKKFIDTNLTHCIIETIYTKICKNIHKITPDAPTCDNLTTTFSQSKSDHVALSLCEYKDLVVAGLAHNKIAFVVMDICDMSFDMFIKKIVDIQVSNVIFKSILFQIIYTIYVITNTYRNFHHYDLHTENILLKLDKEYVFDLHNPTYLQFNIKNKIYNVPYFGIIPKIIDFGFSILPEEGIISDASQNKTQMFYRSENDLLLLFYWIDKIIYNLYPINDHPILLLLEKLEPTRVYIHYYTEYIRKVEDKIQSYEDMILNDVWQEYTIPIEKKHIYKKFDPVN